MTERIALVTGGTRGIGRGIARALAEAGHAVALLYRKDEAAAAEALAELEAAGAAALAVAADIADPATVRAAVDHIVQALGPPTVLVNNAFRGGRPPAKLHEVDPEAWAEDLRTNLDGPFHVTQVCLPHMMEAGFGRVVYIGSLAARGEPGRAAYSTAKSALAGLSGAVAREYAKHGITSNVVNPGFIEAGAFERLSDEIKSRALRSVPARRAGRTDEIGAMVRFLASDEAAYLTGQVIGVDGGAR